jgi:subtilisin-like proprotein convertase family protein
LINFSQQYYFVQNMRLLLMLGALCFVSILSAQSSRSFFQSIDETILPASLNRPIVPTAYEAYRMDYAALSAVLRDAPEEKSTSDHLNIELPRADGSFHTFAVYESSVMPANLQAKYPQIRTYTGYSLTENGTSIKIINGPYFGLKVMIRRGDKGVEYVERLATDQNEYYMVYDRRTFPPSLNHPELRREVDLLEVSNEYSDRRTDRWSLGAPQPEERGSPLSKPVTLKIYRFACAATGEFSLDHGGTTASVLEAMVGYTAQLNAIYERDLAIRLILVDNVETILFLDPATDPYTGTTVGETMNQNPAAMIQTIGFDSYDVGHVFARYMVGDPAAGVAGGQCCTNLKGRGCSSALPPYGDYFLSVIGQEIGHQWAGGHTWTHCGTAGGDAPQVACEPGSGSTIMSYAGTCANGDNIQNSSDLYYHVCSIVEIRNFVENGTGNTCGSSEVVNNMAPVVTIAHPNGLFIPRSTPFELNGSAVDPEGQPMTYCWEQIDLGPLVSLGQPSGSTPIFRSFPPSTATNRIFPRIQTILANNSNNTEILPTYNRDLTFCLTARDNFPGAGGVGIDTIELRCTADAGPFRVLSPNTANATWRVGEYQTITWDVANTNLAPVNCQKVNILLSTNGGLTFPVVLASNIENNGSVCVLVPDQVSNTVRIRVEAADNIFFDLSNANFKIIAPTTPGFAICLADAATQNCLPQAASITIGNNNWLGFNDPINYTVQGLPVGVNPAFSTNPAPAGEDVTLSLDLTDLPENTYNFTVIANAATVSDTIIWTVTTVSNNFATFVLSAPADGSTGVSQSPTLTWTSVADANKYQVQVSTSPTFATLLYDNANVTTNEVVATANLEKGKVYYWRVRPLNECGAGPWSAPNSFATQVEVCLTYGPTDLPKAISTNGTPTVESIINIPSGGTISDVNVTNLELSHDAFSQLEVRLLSPANTSVLLFKNRCGFSSVSMNGGFDDAAAITTFPCPPNNDQVLKPTQALSLFNGQSSTGNWILQVKDTEVGSGGTLAALNLEICSASAVNIPFIVNNNVLSINNGTNGLIGNDLLRVDDADNGPATLIYTVVEVPANGVLDLAGVGTLTQGSTFTQSAIDNGGLRYFHYGTNSDDFFRFAVTDGNGGLVSGKFVIDVLTGTSSAVNTLRFDMRPNPANDVVRFDFGQGLDQDAQLTLSDMTGRAIRQVALAKGQTTHFFNLNELPAGTYSVQLRTATGFGVARLIKL